MDYTSVLTVILHILILIQVFFSLRRLFCLQFETLVCD